MDKIGKPVVFNICVLGALLGITPLVREESLLAMVKERIPKNFISLNTDAFNLGLEIGRGYLQSTN
jgi:2-oxoglutarate ferredoxin oxidoreductase subunit gamma